MANGNTTASQNPLVEQPSGFSVSELLKNPLFLSMISQAGASINPNMAGINQLTQNVIGSQNLMKILSKMLSGEVPEGGKLSMDSKGVKVEVPVSALSTSQESSTTAPQTMAPAQTAAPASTQQPNISTNLMRALNPFAISQQGISASDLAGLTPKDVLEAFQTAAQTTYMTGLAQAQMAQAEARRLEEWRRIKEIPEKVPVKVGDQTLYVDPKEALDYYAKVNELPVSYETYKLAREDPEFKSYLLEMAKAGSTKVEISPYEASKQRTLGTSAGEIMAPDRHVEIRKRLEDSGFRPDPDRADAIAKKYGIDYKDAKEYLMRAKVIEEHTQELRALYPDSEIEFKDDGWYKDGVLIKRNPYYAK